MTRIGSRTTAVSHAAPSRLRTIKLGAPEMPCSGVSSGRRKQGVHAHRGPPHEGFEPEKERHVPLPLDSASAS